MEKRQIPVKTL